MSPEPKVYENASALDYLVTFVGNLRRTLVWSITRKKNGFVAKTHVKREPVGRILPQIYRYEIQQWRERHCDSFIWKEVDLWGKSERNTRDYVFYSERLSNQYEIFWVKFPEELFHWIDMLQEAPEFQECIKKTYTWDTEKITTLHQLDHQMTWVVDFWVHTNL